MAGSAVVVGVVCLLAIVAGALNCTSSGSIDCAAPRTLGELCASASCCAATSFGGTCSRFRMRNSSTASTTTTACVANGALQRCDSGGAVVGVCSGSSCAPCNVFTTVGRVTCSSDLLVSVNASDCAWRFGSGAVGCYGFTRQVVAGVCLSTAADLACGGSVAGVYCCALRSGPSQSASSTASASGTAPSTTASATALASATASTTVSRSVPSPTRASRTASAATRSPTQPGPSASLTAASRSLANGSASATASRRRVSQTPDSVSRTVAIVETATRTLRTRSAAASPTRTHFEPPRVAAFINNSVALDGIHDSGASFLITLGNAVWNAEALAFLDLQFAGTQSWNPFGFDQRRAAMYGGAELLAPRVVRVTFAQDYCFDPRGDESVTLSLTSAFVRPPVAAPVSATLLIDSSSRKDDTRSSVGLFLVLLVVVLLLAGAALGNQGVAVLLVVELQATIVLGRQWCSRTNIAGYFEHAWWLVTPTQTAPGFSIDQQFGVVVVHSLVSAGMLCAFVLLARRFKKARLFFPSLPLTVCFLLLIGSTNAAWRSMVHGGDPSFTTNNDGAAETSSQDVGFRVGSGLIWIVYFVGFAWALWRIRSPRGLVFLLYATGSDLLALLRGTHSPQQLRSKYALLIDMWHEDHTEHASQTHLLHLSVTAVVSALSWNTTQACFAVVAIQMVWLTLVFLVVAFVRPARSPLYNLILLLHAAAPLLLVVAMMLSLDCVQNYPSNVNAGEGLAVTCLLVHVATALLQLLAIVKERSARRKVEREAQLAREQHRRQSLGLAGAAAASSTTTAGDADGGGGDNDDNDGGGVTAAVMMQPLPPLTHRETRPRVVEDPLAALAILPPLPGKPPPAAAAEVVAPRRQWATLEGFQEEVATHDVLPQIRLRLLDAAAAADGAPTTAAAAPVLQAERSVSVRDGAGEATGGGDVRCERCFRLRPREGICIECARRELDT